MRILVISLIDLMTLKACQSIWGYFMPRSKEITFIVHSNLHFRAIVSQEFFLCGRSNRIRIIFKKINLSLRCDPNRYYHYWSEWTWTRTGASPSNAVWYHAQDSPFFR